MGTAVKKRRFFGRPRHLVAAQRDGLVQNAALQQPLFVFGRLQCAATKGVVDVEGLLYVGLLKGVIQSRAGMPGHGSVRGEQEDVLTFQGLRVLVEDAPRGFIVERCQSDINAASIGKREGAVATAAQALVRMW